MRHKITISLDVEDGYLADTLRIIANEIEEDNYGTDLSSFSLDNADVEIKEWKEYAERINLYFV